MRSYKYDALGRLLYEKIPEQSATINDGTGNYWSSKYTYTEFSAVSTKQDARGVVSTYGYDALHRVTGISYNTVGGVTTAPAVGYGYDSDVGYGTSAPGKLVRINVGSDYQERYTFDSNFRVSSTIRTIGARTYTTSYNTYNEASQLTQMTYPSTRQLDFSYDSIGRPSAVTGYLSNIGYNIAGQVTGDTLGNGVTEQFGYDTNRLQVTSQKAGTVSPYTNRMDLTYSYNAAAGQMGASTTAGNAGQLMAINNNSTIGGTTESAAYTYDNVGRLVTSNQTSNGSSAQRRFDYDRWGNRTGVWDAVSGGNQIQSVALEQSGGAPTNRIQTLYPPRTNFALSANGSSASASSNYSSAYVPSAAINGDRKGTNWGEVGGGWMDSTSNSYPDWVQVTFNGSKTIDEIDVFTVQDNFSNPSEPTESMTFSQYGIVNFQIQYWNGLGWQTVSGGSITGNNKVWKKVSFSQITTSKIRVNVTNALGNYSRVTELEAWGPGVGINYSYDAAGNVTNDGVHTYQYDSENRLVSVDSGTTASYAYDHQNRRNKKTMGSTLTHYVWEGVKVIAEHNGGTGAVLADYIFAGSRMIVKVVGGTTSYLLSDRLSARLTLNTSGTVVGRQAHLPFGDDFAESGTQDKHHFTSYERDSETGTDYAVNRQYSQGVGRFMRVDPYGGSKSTANPQSLNRYAYVLNKPLDYVDPLGMNLADPNGGGPTSCSLAYGMVWYEGVPMYGIVGFDCGANGSASGADKPKRPKIKYSDLGNNANLFFGFHNNCIKVFEKMGIYTKFLKKAHNAHYADLRDEANLPLQDWSPAGLDLDKSRTTTLGAEDLWDVNGPLGLTIEKANVIFIGAAVTIDADLQQTVVHEGLHNYFQEPKHVALLVKLNALDKDLKFTIPEGPGAELLANLMINKWLTKDCKTE